jgi:DUF177 domain-containing protein
VTASSPGDVLTYNVAGLLGDAVGESRTYAIAGVMLDLGPDLAQADPVEGSIRLARTNRGILVTGRLSTTLAETCSRCLREVEVPIAISLEEEALPSIDLASGLPVDVSAEPDAVRLTDHHELELEPLVREAILLAEPIAPLCRPDCPGLCIVCGGELSEGMHDHDGEEIDPRLEALRGFRVDGNGETG